ncbi:sodium/proton antiporter (CPA1 family) [Lentzea atacamensis]|uniref:Sodium/proton antiporter (CPA1 family) n=1 Tax=Lentzea atacamensis TaxID=531938 RepID=A0A316I3B4_9PSEU|nr:cation:proton antiporter [Lentzea atacamensis]PWK87144.1 sodium/proton antiporter (CPA1 family) [Lentzea atacamensis]
MNSLILMIAVAIAIRSFAAARLDRWNLGAPVITVAAGVVIGLVNENSIAIALNTEAMLYLAEIILAVLLFVDATEVRAGRLWGTAPGLAARVLLLAMPLSLVAAMLLGWWLFPGLPWPVLLLLAGVVVPIDFAPAERVVRDRGLSMRVRSVLNVEGGYNDGIISPLFLFALILAGDQTQQRSPLDALATVLPFALKALGVGLLFGAVLALLLSAAHRAGWLTEQSGRIVVLLVPLLTYTATVAVDGNGFVASFICGVTFRYVHRLAKSRQLHRSPNGRELMRAGVLDEDFRLLEDFTTLLTMTLWFVVGVSAVLVFSFGLTWQVVLFCLAALTVVRVLPVQLSLTGSSLSPRERLLVGVLGPRGTTSVVFGLLAFNRLPEGPVADTILAVTVACVLGSVLLHGIGAAPAVRWLTPAKKS